MGIVMNLVAIFFINIMLLPSRSIYVQLSKLSSPKIYTWLPLENSMSGVFFRQIYKLLCSLYKSHVGMRQIQMLTTVEQTQKTWEQEFSDPPRCLVLATFVYIGISHSFFYSVGNCGLTELEIVLPILIISKFPAFLIREL